MTCSHVEPDDEDGIARLPCDERSCPIWGYGQATEFELRERYVYALPVISSILRSNPVPFGEEGLLSEISSGCSDDDWKAWCFAT